MDYQIIIEHYDDHYILFTAARDTSNEHVKCQYYYLWLNICRIILFILVTPFLFIYQYIETIQAGDLIQSCPLNFI